MIKTTPLSYKLLSAWTAHEPTDTIHRVCFCESNTAFQAHVLFPLEVSVRKLFLYQFLLCLLLSLSPSWAETLVQAVTRSLCNCYIPLPASPSLSCTCSFAKSPIQDNPFFTLSIQVCHLNSWAKKSRAESIYPLQKVFIFP